MSVIHNYRNGARRVRRPCERTWRDILEWAWSKGVEGFTDIQV
ncbi:MAG: hypothetical protein QMD95_03470 [Candidatus Hodarchaeaceae archaeon]|nr:hypothetical protein [Candidatus Hodarchaeaceae archaeon]